MKRNYLFMVSLSIFLLGLGAMLFSFSVYRPASAATTGISETWTIERYRNFHFDRSPAIEQGYIVLGPAVWRIRGCIDGCPAPGNPAPGNYDYTETYTAGDWKNTIIGAYPYVLARDFTEGNAGDQSSSFTVSPISIVVTFWNNGLYGYIEKSDDTVGGGSSWPTSWQVSGTVSLP